MKRFSYQFSGISYQHFVDRLSVLQSDKLKTGRLISDNRKPRTDNRIVVFFLSLLIFLLLPLPAFAQDTSSGIATYVKISDKNVQDGDIIKFTKDGYKRADTPYDTSIFGVVVKNPAMSLESGKIPNALPVVTNGKVYVRVSTKNGPIKSGDLITTSTTPGVGQKATENGYVVGTALEDYKDTGKIGRIVMQLNITFNGVTGSTTTNLLSTFRLALSSPYLTPLNALRYVFATGIVLVALFMSVTYFGRMATTGVEALGRNPLAGKSITVGIVINVSLGIGIIGLAIAVAYLILTV